MMRMTVACRAKLLIGVHLFVAGTLLPCLGGKVIYPWRSTTAIVKSGESFEAWFDADSGQRLNGVELRGPYHTVPCTMSVMTGDWEYDQMSGNRYDTRITVTVPAGTPEDRYDLVLKTSSGDEVSLGGVKVVTAFRDHYYIMHISDAHFYQANYDTDVLLQRKSAMIDSANIMDAQLIIETGDNSYNVRNHPEREVMIFQGNEALGINGNADACAATFLTPGDHDAYAANDWVQTNEQVNADFFNTYWGLQNHSFSYGNGRFMNLNNAWNVSTTSAKNHAYQINEALAWLSGDGAGGDFFVTAGHVYDKMHEFIDDAEPLDLVLAGDKHHAWPDNPYSFDDGRPAVAYIAPAIRDYFRFNLFRINNAAGSFTPVPGSLGVAEVLDSGNKNDPATWVPNLELSYAVANDGTASENTATIVNRFDFPIEDAFVRFVMPKGVPYAVSPGEVRQAFDGDQVHVVDVRIDLDANSTTAIDIFPGGALSNNAQFVEQTVPSEMEPGVVYPVSITMKNNGIDVWNAVAGHGLGSRNPQNNTRWTGSNRIPLSSSVASNYTATFSFNVTAPSEQGFYDFQWRMVDDAEPNAGWFGAYTPNVKIGVGLEEIHVEAESFVTNVGFQTQATTDVGDGLNIGFTDAGDYLTYEMDVEFAGVYQLISRNASFSQPTSFDVILGGQVLCSVNEAATGGYQTWQSFTNGLTLPAGSLTLKILATGNGWNMNWFKLVPIDNPPPVTAPTVGFNVPSGNISLDAGDDLYVHVNASDPDGIERVWLYKDGAMLSRSEGLAPYEWGGAGQNDPELQNLQEGSFVLTARTRDNTGEEAWTIPGIAVTVGGGQPQQDNLVQNPSFESGAAGWTFFSADTGSSVVYDGTASLQLNALGDKAQQVVSTVPGTTYHFSFRVYGDSMTAPKLVVDTFDVYDDTCQFLITGATGGWKAYSGSFEATTGSVTLRFFTSQIFAGTVYVDDVSLVAEPQATAYEIWAANNRVTGQLLDDDDDDGWNNLLEYGLNGMPTNGLVCGVAPVLDKVSGQLCYIHLKRNDNTNLIYQLETNTNLVSGAWIPSAAVVLGTADRGGGNDYDVVTNSIPLEDDDQFVRLRIMLQ